MNKKKRSEGFARRLKKTYRLSARERRVLRNGTVKKCRRVKGREGRRTLKKD